MANLVRYQRMYKYMFPTESTQRHDSLVCIIKIKLNLAEFCDIALLIYIVDL
jgi:hypothetical protein